MSASLPSAAGRVRFGHPEVLRTRARALTLGIVTALIPLVLALAISAEISEPSGASVAAAVGLALGVVAVIVLMLSTRYTVTLTLLALYLGLLDGPIKLEVTSHHLASSLRDVLIAAIVLGMVMRVLSQRERVRPPGLVIWVVAFVAIVLVEALNPHTNGILKSLGGYRQQLEWVPFFFFGYLVMRGKQRFRQLFLLLGVIALANGAVGAYQSRISPGQLASWGPGYSELVKGGEGNGITARTYSTEGVARVRPPALGSDAGFGGGVGVLALPGLLALLSVGSVRRRWPELLCCAGALLGVATSASRTSTVVAVVVLLGFGGLSLVAGLRVGRPLATFMVIALMALVVGSILSAADGSSVFARQETLASLQRAQETGGGGKERSLSQIPSDLVHAPFGLGLGTAGSASGFGGSQRLEIEGQRVEGGSAYILLIKELGLPGLLLWIGLSVNVLVLAVPRLRRVRDTELRTYLVAMLAGFIALALEGLSAPTLAVTIGAFLWFVPGVIAYWFAGAGWPTINRSPASAQ